MVESEVKEYWNLWASKEAEGESFFFYTPEQTKQKVKGMEKGKGKEKEVQEEEGEEEEEREGGEGERGEGEREREEREREKDREMEEGENDSNPLQAQTYFIDRKLPLPPCDLKTTGARTAYLLKLLMPGSEDQRTFCSIVTLVDEMEVSILLTFWLIFYIYSILGYRGC